MKARRTCSRAIGSRPIRASRGKGVLVVLNDEINSARDVTKTDAHRLDTFQSRDYGILGVVDSRSRRVLPRRGQAAHAEERVRRLAIEELPRVDVVLTYQGATGDIIKAVVDRARRASSSRRPGAGATSGTQEEGIRYAVDKGRVRRHHHPDRRRPNRGEKPRRRIDLATADSGRGPRAVKARILLMLALTRTRTAPDIQRMFTEY